MTLRPEVEFLVVSAAFIVGVFVGGAVADDGTEGWPKTLLVVSILLGCVLLLCAIVACACDLFWGRGFTV